MFDPDSIFTGYNRDYIACIATRGHRWNVWRVHGKGGVGGGFVFGGVRRISWRKWLLWCDRCTAHKVEVFNSQMELVSRWYRYPWDWRIEGFNINEIRREAKAYLMDHEMADTTTLAVEELAEQMWSQREKKPAVTGE